jgi:hypothetical protein
MVSGALIEVKRWSGLACERLGALLERLVGARRRAAGAPVPWHALVAVLRAHLCRGTRSSHRGGQASKSKSCCGGPLAGRMGSR